ncbi:MAG TPA: HAD domain-containing protein [Vicinamibacteria bacterium]
MAAPCYDLQSEPVVFLDIDGTLRRTSAPKYQLEGHLVENLEMFLVSRREDSQVVITSSWKDVYTLDRIRAHFPSSLQQIVGTTPALETVREHQWYREIRAYLKKNGLEESDWIAIDDQAELFPAGLKNLILVDASVGFEVPARADLL